jgi:hypothetical protein
LKEEGMTTFQMLEYAAWGLSAIFGAYMLFDLFRIDSAYSEEVLMSSREGEIEDEFVVDPTHHGRL